MTCSCCAQGKAVVCGLLSSAVAWLTDKKTVLTSMSRKIITTLLVGAVAIQASTAMADFLEGATGSLELRNMYYSRDFRNEGAAQSKRDEWAQGFILNLQSGFTQGRVGVGVDALGTLGVKLDSSPDRTGSGILAFDSQRQVEDEYSKLTLTAKARAGQTQVHLGGLHPTLPLLWSNNSRLLPQVFRGGMLVSNDLQPLRLTLLRVNRLKQRNSTDFERLTAFGYTPVEADHLDYLALDYQAADGLTLSYHLVELDTLYRSHFAGVKFSHALALGELVGDIRYFAASETGSERLGDVDNRTLSSLFAWRLAGHSFGVGYQKARGDTPFAFVNGTDTYLFGESLVSAFSAPGQRVRLLRYDYDFAALGLPGLSLGIKYAKGDQVDPTLLNTVQAAGLRARGVQGGEWERMTDIAYTVQDGTFEGLSLQWRNATNRSTYADSADENRLILRYTFQF